MLNKYMQMQRTLYNNISVAHVDYMPPHSTLSIAPIPLLQNIQFNPNFFSIAIYTLNSKSFYGVKKKKIIGE